MADFSTNVSTTLDPVESIQEPARTADGAAAADGAAVAAPARLDNPIERADLSAPATFIPESVDQLLAHSQGGTRRARAVGAAWARAHDLGAGARDRADDRAGRGGPPPAGGAR